VHPLLSKPGVGKILNFCIMTFFFNWAKYFSFFFILLTFMVINSQVVSLDKN
jgi:hypothetical protein